MSTSDTDVLIVGCGLTGSSAAVLLRRFGVRTTALERRVNTYPWPRTRMILGRSMEIYRTAGLEQQIRARASLFAEYPEMARARTVAGQEFMRGETEGMDEANAYSPAPWQPIDQHRLEPLLREQAVACGARLEYGAKVVEVEQDDAAVTAWVEDAGTGAVREIRARYLVATDGAEGAVRRQLGIAMRGPGVVGHYVNIVFRADITGPLRDRPVGLWFLDEPRPGSVIMPQAARHQWILMVPHDPATGETLTDFDDATCTNLVRAAVGLPGLDVTIVPMSDEGSDPVARMWEVGACVAERFQQGRIFLVGDSAHLMPPVGAFGANLGIQDAHNLAWKLAAVVNGQAGPELLESYERERLPVAEVTVDAATTHLNVRSVAGGEGNTTGGNLAVIFGYRYRSTAVLDEGDLPDVLLEPADLRGQPGTRAPHLSLLRDGVEISTIDLYADRFVLVAGSRGERWVDAAAKAAKDLDLPVAVHRIGADLDDPSGGWSALHGVGTDGAVLVRPDGFVAWRARHLPGGEEAVLTDVLSRVLGRAARP
ncbi:FAD-dependent monooxygenase [Parafrankia sp. FMc2]|uniref:FAD-dependent monooxygenase n=1 Tax=Parafrankia sp. FMc2 TaxID=3233196 RepID=UPI0034D48E35